MPTVGLTAMLRTHTFYSRIAREYGYSCGELLLAVQRKVARIGPLESFMLEAGESLHDLADARNTLKQRAR